MKVAVMFCPQCKDEYREGVKICFDCNVPLVETLSKESILQRVSTLRYATLSALIGISYLFTTRTIGTLSPGIFRVLFVSQINQILSLFASLTIVFFFVSFYKEYIHEDQTRLKNASALAIIGSSAILLVHIRGLFLVFNAYIPSDPFGLRIIESIETILPWIGSIFISMYFITFYQETFDIKSAKLNKAILFAIVGSLIAVLIRFFILFHYIYSREVRWLSDLPGRLAIAFLPICAFAYITILYFLITFYKEQKAANGDFQ